MSDSPVIAIVGVGFAGAATAVALLRGLAPGARGELHLIERRSELGRGVAYSARDPGHLLNVPAGAMSLFEDEPDDLVRWLAAHGHEASPATHVARGVYGDYVADTLARAVAAAPEGWRIVTHREEAIGVVPEDQGYVLRFAAGGTLRAGALVFAWGPLPPARPGWAQAAGPPPAWLVLDPWSPEAQVAARRVLLVGSGLTAADLAVSLLASTGAKVWLVSRRGRLPPAVEPIRPYPDWWRPPAGPIRAAAILRRIRQEVGRAEAAGFGWRDVLEALRPHTPSIWEGLSLVERRRFLRHARPFWEAHRHQMPAATAERLGAALAEGRLDVRAGRVMGLEGLPGGGVRVDGRAPGGAPFSLTVDRVVVCTGPDGNYRRVRTPLAQALVGSGLGRPDPLSLGLDVAPDGALRDEDGFPSPRLWAVGAARRGMAWEVTGVRELRVQAAGVAVAVRRALGL